MSSSETETEPLFTSTQFMDLFEGNDINTTLTMGSFGPLIFEECDDAKLTFGSSGDSIKQNQEVVAAPPLVHQESGPSAALASIPVLDSWPGRYQFAVDVHTPSASDRQPPYVYSATAKKLYTDVMVNVPVSFRAEGVERGALRIRALPVYRDAHNVQHPVRRCVLHRDPDHKFNVGQTHLSHVIRAAHPDAKYQDIQERCSVTVPFELPEPGAEEYKALFSFACMNTCIGGINRRSLVVVFTLEDRWSGAPVGRQTIEVKVCRCPHRDWRTDEKRRDSDASKARKRPRETTPPRQVPADLMVPADDPAMYEYLMDARRSLLRDRRRRQESAANATEVQLCRMPTTPIKAELDM